MDRSRDHELLSAGLTGLARAGGVGWFQGHYGAAVLAGAFLLRRKDLPPAVRDMVAEHAASILRAQPSFFAPLPRERAVRDWESALVAAIAPSAHELRRSGHGVIYGALALRAARDVPELLGPTLLRGLTDLLQRAFGDGPDRYYGMPDYLPTARSGHTYRSAKEMALRTFEECRIVFPDGEYGGRFHFLSGEKLHAVTYAQALADLEELGYPELARDGYPAHRRHLELTRLAPPHVAPVSIVAPGRTPRDIAYWQRDHFDDHALKLAYAGLALLDRLSIDERSEAIDPATFWPSLMR